MILYARIPLYDADGNHKADLWVDHHALVQGCAYQTRRMANNP